MADVHQEQQTTTKAILVASVRRDRRLRHGRHQRLWRVHHRVVLLRRESLSETKGIELESMTE